MGGQALPWTVGVADDEVDTGFPAQLVKVLFHGVLGERVADGQHAQRCRFLSGDGNGEQAEKAEQPKANEHAVESEEDARNAFLSIPSTLSTPIHQNEMAKEPPMMMV